MSLRDGLTEQESSEKIRRMNRSRKSFYNYTGEGRWGEASNYNLCIDSRALGTDGTVSFGKCSLNVAVAMIHGDDFEFELRKVF